MTEILQLMAEAAHRRASGAAYAVATVVRIGGSTYRRPGARMLVCADGHRIGMISGGCLEAEVSLLAKSMLERASVQLASFDLTDEDTIAGFGMGCNGSVEVLIESFPCQRRLDPLKIVQACHENRQRCVIVHVIGGADNMLGRRLVYWEDGRMEGDADAVPASRQDALSVLRSGKHAIKQGKALEMLFEVAEPPVRLVLFGSGHDVAPVARMSSTLGWSVTVVGRKPASSLANIVPCADEYIFLMHPERVSDRVRLDTRSAAVVMNHHYVRDRTLIAALLESAVPYIGVLGPRERATRLIRDVRANQPALPECHHDRLYGPVGLDIGGETPEEVALAIVAEIQTVMHNRQGGMLRHRAGAIHEPLCDLRGT